MLRCVSLLLPPFNTHCRLIAERMAADEQTAAVQSLLGRLLPPEDVAKFRLRVDDAAAECSDASSSDQAIREAAHPAAASFEAWSDGMRVHVRGTTGVEVAAGILHFLKYRQKQCQQARPAVGQPFTHSRRCA